MRVEVNEKREKKGLRIERELKEKRKGVES